MAHCKHCKFYNEKYDIFIMEQHDCDDESDTTEKHGCIMYTDCIPNAIWGDANKCPYYQE